MNLSSNASNVFPKLPSLRAMGLLNYYIRSGGYVPTAKVASEFAEGRDAIRSALAELVDRGIVEVERSRVGNQWSSKYRLNSGGIKQLVGISGPLTVDPLLDENTITVSTKDSIYISNGTFINRKTPIEMNTKQSLVSKKEKEETEPDVSSYIQTGWPTKSPKSHRTAKPEDTWTTQEIAAEFIHTAYSQGFADTGTIPGDEVAKIINKLVTDGMTRYQILHLARKYFAVNLLWIGKQYSKSLWARFMSFAYEYRNTVEREPMQNLYISTPEEKAHQERMLGLLRKD